MALANDKLFTAWQLHAAGVPVPRFGVPRDFGGADAAMAALGGPVVVKPRVSRGGRGVIVIDGSEEVDWHRLPEGQIVQEFIPGAEYGPMVFGAPAHNGTAPFVVVVEKTELAQGNVGNAVTTRRAKPAKPSTLATLRWPPSARWASPARSTSTSAGVPTGLRWSSSERPVRREQRAGP